MIKKDYSKDGKTCKVTFIIPSDIDAQSACVCGDFNNWDLKSSSLQKDKDGNLSVTVKLEAGKEYKFRYCVDNSRWENDPDADAQIPNPFGSDDSVIKV
ncbi:MAG: 1,4-alpha-glucan-branching protein [Ignavibacteriota bacterium]|jgi:1,4-alpha-glucan branching enzyme|nr:isoamylase early set domain-containing protein [Ignavibacterium album]GIK61843.1 MAG: 1,4-alpha-glucan-branching protein [Ignavibacteriota bacterium]